MGGGILDAIEFIGCVRGTSKLFRTTEVTRVEKSNIFGGGWTRRLSHWRYSLALAGRWLLRY
jgi:hypothetical protein